VAAKAFWSDSTISSWAALLPAKTYHKSRLLSGPCEPRCPISPVSAPRKTLVPEDPKVLIPLDGPEARKLPESLPAVRLDDEAMQ
jgi:hypothetical protein